MWRTNLPELLVVLIMPSLGSAVPDVPETRWPSLAVAELTTLRPKISTRPRKVVATLINQNVGSRAGRLLARLAFGPGGAFTRRSTVASVIDTIRAYLNERELMTQQ